MNKFMLLTLILPFPLSAETETLDWQVLAPAINEQQVALPPVTESQKHLLATVIQYQSRRSNTASTTAQAARESLTEQGVDVDAAIDARARYMSQAQRKAENLNTDLDGRSVSMSGFVVPTKFNGVKATEFLLLPYAGACIHMPPPAANQIIKLSYPAGFEVESVQFPVTVRGVIKADKKTELVQLVDGKMNITMGYAMEATVIEKYYRDATSATMPAHVHMNEDHNH
ncbi:DUF3299 domain-containing protein [Shewanella sp. KX20019]|uniref:DUF3299 domain-containing protein n=1 Tax=Shewanella sp. KX20019 TaxID=2803864 RepID=UPI0019262D7E|nr:DUF3299 domain-containing protein [Shewanella sp. KX20019]QQX79142.1 DUF3299 domain-containing protein [Shewanella sp. KX20019]